MQLFAKDEKGTDIPASKAQREHSYFCPECTGPVRIRGGRHRRKHYYHLSHDRLCSRAGKTLLHIQTQLNIETGFPPGDITLEKRFPEINRIADVVLESKKIIFEVQCSPITAKEIAERNRDYGKIGYKVIWILHDSRYNKERLTEAEHFLFTLPHYFTNINSEGEGMIYDPVSRRNFDRRERYGSPFPVNLACSFPASGVKTFPGLHYREQIGNFYFEGDLCDLAYKNLLSEELIEILRDSSEEKRGLAYRVILFCKRIQHGIQNIYSAVLTMFLESACKG